MAIDVTGFVKTIYMEMKCHDMLILNGKCKNLQFLTLQINVNCHLAIDPGPCYTR